MYQDYDRAVSEVMEYLFRNNYSSSIVYMHKRCFRLFTVSEIQWFLVVSKMVFMLPLQLKGEMGYQTFGRMSLVGFCPRHPRR